MIEFISQLPTEYQEVEYIQSSGTQYIDTGFVVNKSDSYVLEIDGLFPSQTKVHQGANAYLQFYVSTNYGIRDGNESTFAVGNRNIVRIEYANQTEKLFIDGIQVLSQSWASYTGVNVKLALFRMGDVNNGWFNDNPAQGTIYGYKVWKDEVLVSDCIPCYRKSDNIVGLYDLVNGVFYTNAGTGNFAKGKNSNSHSDAVITPGGVIPMQYALRRRMMMPVLGIDVANLVIEGSCTFQDYGVVQMNDGDYRLLAITGSGNIVLSSAVNCEVCVVGGGANGNGFNGGAGAYLKNQVIEAFNGGPVVVGAAQGASSIGGVSVSAVSGKNGGTGAGCGYRDYNSPGSGDGISKYPFGDINYSLWSGKPHCGAGGAGGEGQYTTEDDGTRVKILYNGGNGGTNGSNGFAGTREYDGYGSAAKGQGGAYGGGQGGFDGDATAPGSGANATYYGSGGGGYGGGNHLMGDATVGSGYQGIVYIRIPVIQ